MIRDFFFKKGTIFIDNFYWNLINYEGYLISIGAAKKVEAKSDRHILPMPCWFCWELLSYAHLLRASCRVWHLSLNNAYRRWWVTKKIIVRLQGTRMDLMVLNRSGNTSPTCFLFGFKIICYLWRVLWLRENEMKV